eukprot:m.37450 g.37450  ORF g.37450 m.37450 type:complete len:147 (-) comp13094_c0_seq1:1020-1460(-)
MPYHLPVPPPTTRVEASVAFVTGSRTSTASALSGAQYNLPVLGTKTMPLQLPGMPARLHEHGHVRRVCFWVNYEHRGCSVGGGEKFVDIGRECDAPPLEREVRTHAWTPEPTECRDVRRVRLGIHNEHGGSIERGGVEFVRTGSER